MGHFLDNQSDPMRTQYAFRPHDYIYMNSFVSLFFDGQYAIVSYLCHFVTIVHQAINFSIIRA